MKDKKIKIACFGEVLWDIFPGGDKRAGGAPFNVAYHLSKMGVEVNMISSVGNDALGRELLQKIQDWKISTAGIQVNSTYPTSTVVATIDEHNDAHYDIVQDVAWDYIEVNPVNQCMVAESDALVFGTLATRNVQSRNTLFELLEGGSYHVFDINLRAPHYDVHVIKDLLYKTQLAKFNNAELRMMIDFMGKSYTTDEDSVSFLLDTFGMNEVIVSKGSKGVFYANHDHFYSMPAVPIEVKDTVGSGDSFLAGFLSKRLEEGTSAIDILYQAVSLGAFVTAREGACPDYTLADFIAFQEESAHKN